MEHKNNNQPGLQLGNKSNKFPAEKKRENPKKLPGNPLPNKLNTPAIPDENPDITRPRPGGNEPEKSDPTRIPKPTKTAYSRVDKPYEEK
jgi:hypothetical protein